MLERRIVRDLRRAVAAADQWGDGQDRTQEILRAITRYGYLVGKNFVLNCSGLDRHTYAQIVRALYELQNELVAWSAQRAFDNYGKMGLELLVEHHRLPASEYEVARALLQQFNEGRVPPPRVSPAIADADDDSSHHRHHHRHVTPFSSPSRSSSQGAGAALSSIESATSLSISPCREGMCDLRDYCGGAVCRVCGAMKTREELGLPS